MKEPKYFIVLNASQASMIIALFGVYNTIYGWFELTSQHYSNFPSFGVGSLNYFCIRALFHSNSYDDLQLQPFYHYIAGLFAVTFLLMTYLILIYGTLTDSKWMVGSWTILGFFRIIAYIITTIYVWNQEYSKNLFRDNTVFIAEVCKFALQLGIEEYSIYVAYNLFKNLIGKISINSDVRYTRFQDQQTLVSNMMLEHG